MSDICMSLKDAPTSHRRSTRLQNDSWRLSEEAQSMQGDRRSARFYSIISPRESKFLVSFLIPVILWGFFFIIIFSCIMKPIYKEKIQKMKHFNACKVAEEFCPIQGYFGCWTEKTLPSLPAFQNQMETNIFIFSALLKYLQFIFLLWDKIA